MTEWGKKVVSAILNSHLELIEDLGSFDIRIRQVQLIVGAKKLSDFAAKANFE